MTPIAAALASASLVFAAAPAMAQMHGGGSHGGGGVRGAAHAAGAVQGAARAAFDGRSGLRGDGFLGHRNLGQRGDGLFDHRNGRFGVWPPGWFGVGYGDYWSPWPYDYGDYQPDAQPYTQPYTQPYAPPPPPALADYPRYRRHDPNACAEWSWVSARRGYVCTRHAS